MKKIPRLSLKMNLRLSFVLIIGIVLLPLSQNAFGKTTQREMVETIKRYDTSEILRTAKSTEEFWAIARDNSYSYRKALSAAESGRARSVQRSMAKRIAEAKDMYIEDEYPHQIVALLDTLYNRSGIGILYPDDAKLYLDPSEYANSYTLPDGSVYITYGMMKLMDFNPDLLMAVYAREISHFILQHSFLRMYRANRNLLHKKILHELFSVVTIGVARYADLRFAEADVPTSLSRNALDLTRAHRRDVSRKEVIDKMYYGRQQEFEADIIAYRFIEFCGIPVTVYPDMLGRLVSDLEIFKCDEKERPLTKDRLQLIRFLQTDPDIKALSKNIADEIYGD